MRSTWRHPAALLLLALLFSPALPAATITGKVVKVSDGDTVHVLDAHRKLHKIRLAGIDAPETGQAYGRKAKNRLLQLVAGELVEVEWNKRDKYKRMTNQDIHNFVHNFERHRPTATDGKSWPNACLSCTPGMTRLRSRNWLNAPCSPPMCSGT